MKPQVRDALARAQEVRLGRSELRRRMKDREVTLEQAIVDPIVATLPIFELLKWQPGLGDKRARNVVARELISELRPVGELTERQRAAVLRRAADPDTVGSATRELGDVDV